MAYKFQLGAANLSGSLTQEGAGEFDTSLTIGSAVLSEADLEKLDDITDGTGAANKALVLDGSRDIDTINALGIASMANNWTNAGRTVADMGSVTTIDINGGTIDGATIATSDVTVGSGKTLNVSAGTLTTSAAQKLAIMQGAAANVDIGAYDLRAATLTADGLTSGRLVFAGANGLLSDDSDLSFSGDTLTVTKIGAFEAAGSIDFSDEAMTNVDINSGAIDGTIIGANAVAAGSFAAIIGTTMNGTSISGSVSVASDVGQFRDLGAEGLSVDNDADVGGALSAVGAISGSAALSIGGTVRFDGVVDAAAVDADSIYFFDADDNLMKKESVTDLRDLYFADVSGDASIAAGGALTIGADAVESGMLNDNVISGQSALGSAAAAQADELLFSDGGTLKKITFSNLEDSIFGNVSGDATIAAGGALTIAANAVQTGMVHDDVATELASGNGIGAASGVLSVAGGDGITAEANGVKVTPAQTTITSVYNAALVVGRDSDNRVDFATDNTLKFYANGNQELTITDSGVVIAGNLTVQGSTSTIDSTTINISSSFLFEGPVDAHETELNCATPVADTTINLPTLSAGTYYIPALADAATDASAAVTAAEFALLDGASSDSSVTVVDADQFIINDGGTMKQTAMSDLKSYMSDVAMDVATPADGGSFSIGMNVVADMGSDGEDTITLPASAASMIGKKVMIKAPSDCSAARYLTVDSQASAQKIDGVDSIRLESPNAAVTLVYVATNSWKVF